LNEDAYNKKMARYRKWYQNKKDLLATEEEIDKTIEELIADDDIE
ncbi:18380_t:CDS:2, partial [Funneliformis geosporum]